jgi:transcriptional regulator with XRE-family HTH domain
MQGTVNERLKILIDALGTNPSALSRMLGISPSTLRNYTDRESKPGYEVIEKLYHSFKHINLPWLFGASGEPLLTEEAGSQSSTITSHKNKGNIQSNAGSHNTITNNVKLEDCQRDLAAAKSESELLREQLASKEALLAAKEALLAAKDETITLLRASYNRPN